MNQYRDIRYDTIYRAIAMLTPNLCFLSEQTKTSRTSSLQNLSNITFIICPHHLNLHFLIISVTGTKCNNSRSSAFNFLSFRVDCFKPTYLSDHTHFYSI